MTNRRQPQSGSSDLKLATVKGLLFGAGGLDISGRMLTEGHHWSLSDILKIFFVPIFALIIAQTIILPGQVLPLAATAILLPALHLLAIWWFAPHRSSRAIGMGRSIPRGFWWHLAASSLVWAVGLRIVTYGIISVQLALFDVPTEALHINNPFVTETGLAVWEQTLFVLSIAVLGPIWEEIFFRGILYRSMGKSWGLVWAAAVSSGVFALMHGSLALFPALFVLGVLMVLLYESTQSLWYPIGVHILFNLSSLVLMLVM